MSLEIKSSNFRLGKTDFHNNSSLEIILLFGNIYYKKREKAGDD